MADLGGMAGARPPRVQILSFWHTKFLKCNCLVSPHPLWGPHPPTWNPGSTTAYHLWESGLSYEIHQISWWNLMDSTWNPLDCMKSGRFHEIHWISEFKWHSPPPVLSVKWSFFLVLSDLKVFRHEIHWISWNLLDFMWNPLDCMKSATVHEICPISCEIHTEIHTLQENKLLGCHHA